MEFLSQTRDALKRLSTLHKIIFYSWNLFIIGCLTPNIINGGLKSALFALYFISIAVMMNISIFLMGDFERQNKVRLKQHAKETGNRKISSQTYAAAMQNKGGYKHLKTKLPALLADDQNLYLAAKWGRIMTRVFLIGFVINLVLFYFAPALSPLHP